MKQKYGLKISIDYLKDSSRNPQTYTFSADAQMMIASKKGIPKQPRPGVFFEWVNDSRRGSILRAQAVETHSISDDFQGSDYRMLTAEIGLDAILQFVSAAIVDGDFKVEAAQLSDLLIALGNSLKSSGKQEA